MGDSPARRWTTMDVRERIQVQWVYLQRRGWTTMYDHSTSKNRDVGYSLLRAERSSSMDAVVTIPWTQRASSRSKVTNASACNCVSAKYAAL
jgi:hypothetical protein